MYQSRFFWVSFRKQVLYVPLRNTASESFLSLLRAIQRLFFFSSDSYSCPHQRTALQKGGRALTLFASKLVDAIAKVLFAFH